MKPQVDLWSTGRRGDIVQLPLVRSLMADGHIEQRIVFSDDGPSRAAFEGLGLPTFATPGCRSSMAAPRTLWQIAKARGALRAWFGERTALVHVTMASAWDQFYLDVAKQSGAQILLTIHDAVHHIGEESKIIQILEQRLIRMADHIAVLSDYAAGRMGERAGPMPPIHVVNPGLIMNSNPPGPPKTAPAGRPMKFLFFGRIRDYKGLDIVLDAWRALKSRDLPAIELTIAGSGDMAKYAPQLKNLRDVTVINGWLSDQDMDSIFSDNDVNLLPYREGSSSATSLAGMWAGMPTIASDIGAFKGQFEPNRNALIMEELSPVALEKCIMTLMITPSLYDKLACGASAHAELLSGSAVAKNWRSLYENIWTERR